MYSDKPLFISITDLLIFRDVFDDDLRNHALMISSSDATGSTGNFLRSLVCNSASSGSPCDVLVKGNDEFEVRQE